MNSTHIYCSRKTGQILRLLFMYRTWTVAASGRKRVKKKKKKKKGKRSKLETQETRIQTHTKCEKEISAPTFPQEKYMLKWLQIER